MLNGNRIFINCLLRALISKYSHYLLDLSTSVYDIFIAINNGIIFHETLNSYEVVVYVIFRSHIEIHLNLLIAYFKSNNLL